MVCNAKIFLKSRLQGQRPDGTISEESTLPGWKGRRSKFEPIEEEGEEWDDEKKGNAKRRRLKKPAAPGQ